MPCPETGYQTVIFCAGCGKILPAKDIKLYDLPGAIECNDCRGIHFIIERVPVVKHSNAILTERDRKYLAEKKAIVDAWTPMEKHR